MIKVLRRHFNTIAIRQENGGLSLFSSRAVGPKSVHLAPLASSYSKDISPSGAYRFDVSQEGGDHGVFRVLCVSTCEGGQSLPLLSFREKEDAVACVRVIENTFYRPISRRVRSFYRFSYFLFILFFVLTILDVLATAHSKNANPVAVQQSQQSYPGDSTASQAPSPSAPSSLAGLTPAQIEDIMRSRSVLPGQSQDPGQSQSQALSQPLPPAPAAPQAGSPGDAVINALQGK